MIVRLSKEKICITLLLVFNLFFPKGGIKIGDGIPITWGILNFFGIAIFLAVYKCSIMKFSLEKSRGIILGMWMPFQILSLVFLSENEVENMGMFFSFLFNLYFLPWCMLLIYGKVFNNIDKKIFFSLLRTGIIFISLYGIFLFIYKIYTGEFVEIPYLTVNFGDIGMLEEKHIDRGGIFKLISTYNNGNIYGVCVLMLLPLFCYLEKRWKYQWIVKLSLLLTLSRTVWIGLITYEIINVFSAKKSLKKILYSILIITIMFCGILLITNFIGREIAEFVFDSSLGGRLGQLNTSMQFTPKNNFEGIGEIVYFSMFYNFGIWGGIFYILAVFSPLGIYYFKWRYESNEIKKRSVIGYAIYLIVSGSDGCMLYVPTMMFFWLLILMMTTRKWNDYNIGDINACCKK